MMKLFRSTLAALLIATTGQILAQDDISGTWAGMLPVGPEATLEIHFVLTRAADGSYSAVLTSPNPDAIQDAPANSTRFADGHLELAVDSLAGRYEGDLANGRFTGNWIQQGTAIPLELAPYVERVLSDEASAILRGSWVGNLSVQTLSLPIVFRFEDNDAGEFVGFLDSPDQGANGIELANIQMENGELSFDIPQIRGNYVGSLDGEVIDGTFNQLGLPAPAELDMTRGEYVSRGLDLPQTSRDRLEGSWVGRVDNAAGGTLAIVFRFETAENGAFQAYLDSPEQGATGVPIGEVVLAGDSLTIEIPAARASFTATLSADAMTGNWAQGNMAQPVTMSRGEYVPVVAVLDLPDAVMQQLAGTWRGDMGPLELIFRFETNAAGDKLAFLDVPAQGASGLSVADVQLSGNQLTLTVAAVGATVTGTLSGNEIQGTWAQGQGSNPLTLTRDP